MKTYIYCIISFLLIVGTQHTYAISIENDSLNHVEVTKATIDPILIKVQSNKDSVKLGEEFTVTVFVELARLNESQAFTFEESKGYSLKILTPKGFVQTGFSGNEDSMIWRKERLQPGERMEYTIKGYYTSDPESFKFEALRGGYNTNSQSLFVSKAKVDVPIKRFNSGDTIELPFSINSKNARDGLAVIDCDVKFLKYGAFIGQESILTKDCSNTCSSTQSDALQLYYLSGGGSTGLEITKLQDNIGGNVKVKANSSSPGLIGFIINCVGGFFSEHVPIAASHPPVITASDTDIDKGESVNLSINKALYCENTDVVWSREITPGSNGFIWIDEFAKGTSTTVTTVSPSSTTKYQVQCWDKAKGSISPTERTSTTKSAYVTITVDDSGGCTTGYVNPPQIAAQNNKTDILFGEKTTLTASGCDGTISWIGPEFTGNNEISIVTGFEGTYSAICTTECGVSAASNSINVIIAPLTIFPRKTQVMVGEEFVMTASGCDGYVQWELPNGDLRSILNSENDKFTGPGLYKARCVDGLGNLSSWVTQTIQTAVSLVPSVSADRAMAYGGDVVNLTASGCGSYDYLWNIHGFTYTGSTQTAVGPGTYLVYCTHNGSSPNGPAAGITIDRLELNTVQITASQSSAGPNESVNLTGSCNASVRWTITDVNGNEVYDFGNTTTVVGPGLYQAVCYSGGDITAPTSIYIEPKPAGAVSVSYNKDVACFDEPVTFQADGCDYGNVVWKKTNSLPLADIPEFSAGVSGQNVSINQNMHGYPLKIGGVTYGSGVGVYTPTSLTFNIGGAYSKFTAVVGRDDRADGCCSGQVSVKFIVKVDGVQVESIVRTDNDPGQAIEVDLNGANTLELTVDPDGQNWADLGNWANAMLVPATNAEEILVGQSVDFFGGGKYEVSCVTGGISGPVTSLEIPSCNSNAPTIRTSKTKVGPTERFYFDVKGNFGHARLIQNGQTTILWGHDLPYLVTGPAKMEAHWSQSPAVKSEVVLADPTNLKVTPNKFTAMDGETVVMIANGCDYGQVEWKIGNLAPSFGWFKVVTGPGYYKARCVPNAGSNNLYTNSEWVLVTIGAPEEIQPIITGPTHMCDNSTATFTATGCPANYNYQWKTAENGWQNWQPTVTITNPQTFKVRCLKQDGSFWYDAKKVDVFPAFDDNFTAQNNGPVLAGSDIKLAATFIDNTTYSWAGPDGFTSTSSTAANRLTTITDATAASAGVYTVTATFDGQCSTTATTEVFINNCNFKIKSINPITQEEQYTLYPDGSGGFNPLVLQVEATDGAPLGNFNFHWTSASGQSFSDPYSQTLQVDEGDVYRVRISPVDDPGVGCVVQVQLAENIKETYKFEQATYDQLANGEKIQVVPTNKKFKFLYNDDGSFVELGEGTDKFLIFEDEGSFNTEVLKIIPINPTTESDNIDGSTFNGLVQVNSTINNEVLAFWQYDNGSKTKLLTPPVLQEESFSNNNGGRKPNKVCQLVTLEYLGSPSCTENCGGGYSTYTYDDLLNGNIVHTRIGDEVKYGESVSDHYEVTEIKLVDCCLITGGVLGSTINCPSGVNIDYTSPSNPRLDDGGEVTSTTISSGGGSPNPPPPFTSPSSRTPYSETICSFVADFLSGSVMPLNLGLEQKGSESVALSKAQYSLYTKLAFEEIKDLGSTINQPTASQIDASYISYQLAVAADNSEIYGANPGDYKSAACKMVGSNIGAGDIINIPPDYKYLDEKKSKVANAFKALNALITECEDDLSNPMACQVADALTTGGISITESISSANGQVYMSEEAINEIIASLGGAGTTARVTTDGEDFELTDNGMTYTNGDCVVKVESIVKLEGDIGTAPPFTINSNNIIMVEKPDGTVAPLHEYPLTTQENRKNFLRVIRDIYEEAGLYLGDGIWIGPGDNPAINNPAYTTDDKIFLNNNGSISPSLSHKFNLLSTLFHEKQHLDDDDLNSYYDHALVYLEELTNTAFFSKCTDDYRMKTIIGYGLRVLKQFETDGINSTNQANVSVRMGNIQSLSGDLYRLSYEYSSFEDILTYKLNIRYNSIWVDYPLQNESKSYEEIINYGD